VASPVSVNIRRRSTPIKNALCLVSMRYPNSMTIENAKIVPHARPLSFNVFVLDSGSNNMVTELIEEGLLCSTGKKRRQ